MKKALLAKVLIIGPALVLLLMLIALLYVNNGAFVQRHVLPRVAAAVGEPLTVAEIRFSLFSGIEIQGLRLGSEAQPFVKAEQVRVRYRWLPLISGRVYIDEILLREAHIQLTDARLARFTAAEQLPSTGQGSPEDALPRQHGGSSSLKLHLAALTVENFRLDADLAIAENGDRLRSSIGPLNLHIGDINIEANKLSMARAAQLQLERIRLEISSVDAAPPQLSLQLNGLAVELDPVAAASQANGRVLIREVAFAQAEAAAHARFSVNLELDARLADDLQLEMLQVRAGIGEFAGAVAGINPGSLNFDYRGELRFAANRQDFDFAGTARLSELFAGKHLSDVSVPTADLQRMLAKMPVLALTLAHRLSVNVLTSTLTVQQLDLEVAEAAGAIVNIGLPPPLQLPLADAAALAQTSAVLAIGMPGYALAEIQPALAEIGIEQLYGTVSADLKLTVKGLLTEMLDVGLEGRLAAQQLQFAMPSAASLAQPVDCTLDLALDLQQVFHDGEMVGLPLKLHNIRSRIASSGVQLLDMSLSGELDLVDSSRQAQIKLTAAEPILADAIAALLLPATAAAPAPQTLPPVTPAPQTSPDVVGSETTAGLPDLWLRLTHDLASVHYKAMRFREVRGEAEYRHGRLELPGTSLRLNDGSFQLQGMLDLTDRQQPQFQGAIKLADLELEPVLQSFLLALPVQLNAGIKQLDLNLSGAGFGLSDLRRNLLGAVNGELASFSVRKPAQGSTANLVMEQLVGRLLPIAWEDLNFTAGSFAANLDPEKVQVRNLNLRSDMLKLSATGQIGRDGTPQLEIGTAFAGRLRQKAEAMRLLLAEPGSDGFRIGPTIPLAGDLRDPMVISRLGLELLRRTRLADRQGLLDSLIGPSRTESEPQHHTEKPVPLENALDAASRLLLQGLQKPKKDNAAEPVEPVKPAADNGAGVEPVSGAEVLDLGRRLLDRLNR